MHVQLLLAALAIYAAPVKAQWYYDGDRNGTSYATRIGIGVGIAVAVALVIFAVGCLMRRRRARAFKTAYPLQQVNYAQNGGRAEQGYGGSYMNQPAQGQQQYGQQYVGAQPAQTGNFDQPPPQYSNYRADSNSHYAPPSGPPPNTENATNTSMPYYAPPTSPPPAASASTAQPPNSNYAPPPGPPPMGDSHIQK
ncbi:hypothetical protein JCM11251_005477 [Rhodosporidiobolus azoricus]